MRLSWNEVRARAAAFAEEWQDATYERGETQSFYNDFFQVFGVKRRTVARYEAHVAKLDNRSGFIDLFWPGVLIVEQKSAGRDLAAAYEQAGEYFDALPERERPRHVLVSDFQTFQLHDLEERDTVAFPLAELPDHVEAFGFILGVQRRRFRDQDPVNIAAAELVGLLHDQLAEAGHGGHDLERFLVRIVFCLFADDTGVFEPRDIFVELIETRTSGDGADLGPWLAQLFQVLDTPDHERPATLDEDLARFPYINGDLFKEPLAMVSCNAAMRSALLDACRFDWSQVSPAIFGALFQSVMDPAQRRAQGAHYTTEKNILKVIEPLFMDDLRSDVRRLQERKDSRRRPALRHFQTRLSSLTFFDPACGCGNFLIIAYRELRLLEIEILKALYPRDRDGRRQLEGWAGDLSQLNVDQFYGIELGEFPARIAETALWMMDHIMNNRLSLEFGQTFVRIPLKTSPNIVHGDALELDWEGVLPAKTCSFVFGNPPFGGFVMRTVEKQRQSKNLMRQLGASGTRLDYVTAWFLKAGAYLQNNSARIGFVATNSITQGEQVAQLWPALLERYQLEIIFAHRSFAWGSDARGKAHVHVVIVGLSDRKTASARRRLFSYESPVADAQETPTGPISPYLIDASGLRDPHLVVERRRIPIAAGLPKTTVGTKPVDGGHYILGEKERAELLAREPGVSKLIRPFVGAAEYINGRERWILHVPGQPPSLLRSLPAVMERIRAVKQYRGSKAGKLGRSLADQPTDFHVCVVPDRPFLVIPEVSSERRDYIPIGWLSPPLIPSNKLLVIENAELWHFALLTSAMHMAWTRHIGGRLESRYQYSVGINYNTFPLPPKDADLSKLEPLAQAVLDARTAHPGATLADLYDPDTMPSNLRRAHSRLDRAVDRLYRRSGFASERERVECLLMVYEGMQGVLGVGITGKKKGRRGR